MQFRLRMSILTWVIFGIIAGAIAKAVHPGPDPGGIIVTMLVGIVGAFIGGLIGQAVFGRGITGFNVSSFMLAVGGSFILLVLYRMGVERSRRRPVT